MSSLKSEEARARARARRRLRCWLGLPAVSELDPVVRRSLSSCLSELWSPAGWSCPAWGREGAGEWCPEFVEAVARSGLCRSAWWGRLPVDMLSALGGWAGCSSVVSSEEWSEELSELLSLWRAEELAELVSELSSSESAAGREAWSVAAWELERRRGRRSACRR